MGQWESVLKTGQDSLQRNRRILAANVIFTLVVIVTAVIVASTAGPELWNDLEPQGLISCDDPVVHERVAVAANEHNWPTYAMLLEGTEPGSICRQQGTCEAARMSQFARAPANAWSSAAFFVSGIVTVYPPLGVLKASQVLHGILQIALSLLSFAWHASLAGLMNRLDVRMMYLAMFGVILVDTGLLLTLLLPKVSPKLIDAAVTATLLSFLIGMHLNVSENAELGTTVGYLEFCGIVLTLTCLSVATPTVYLQCRKVDVTTARRWLIAAAVALLAALVAAGLDKLNLAYCDPFSPLQGTAGLHVFGGLALICNRQMQKELWIAVSNKVSTPGMEMAIETADGDRKEGA